MSRIRVGVVGCTRGLHHAQGYALAQNRAELMWVADLREDLVRRSAEKLGCNPTTDWESRLHEVDALSITTGHHLHARQAILAMEAGKHVLVEKPLAMNNQEYLNMVAAAKANDVRLMCAYQLRYWPAVRWVQRALAEGRYGPVRNVACWTHVNRWSRDATLPSKKEKGGGALFSHGCHYIDLMISFLGLPSRVAYIGGDTDNEAAEGEGSAQAIMEFSNGALGHYEIHWGVGVSALTGQMHFYFPDALLVLHIAGRVDLVTKDGNEVLFEARDIDSLWRPGENTIGQINHFLDCIERRKAPLTDADDAMKSLRTIWRMYDAEAKGTPS